MKPTSTLIREAGSNKGPDGRTQSSPSFRSRPETAAEQGQNARVAARAYAAAAVAPCRVNIDYYGNEAVVTFCDGRIGGRKVRVSAA